MNKREAIATLQGNVIYACENAGFNTATINLVTEALDLATEALEREIEYGQIVVDFMKGETMKSDEWKYDTTCDTESATTTDCISRQEAIEAFCDDCAGLKPGQCEYWDECETQKVLRSLPLVTSTVNEDCVNREYLKSFGYINKGDFNSVETIREWIDNAPSVTPTERTGEWKIWNEPGNKFVYCPKCKHEYDQIDLYIGGSEYPNYCPNCGAKMKG